MAYEALSAHGVGDPGRHIAVIGDGREVTAPFANVIVSKRAAAHAAGRSAEFYSTYRFNVAAVTDDDPFFFSYRRWSDVLPHPSVPSVEYYDNMLGAKPMILLIVLVLQATGFVLLLVVWPVVRFRH